MGSLTRQFRMVAASLIAAGNRAFFVGEAERRADSNKGPCGQAKLSHGAKVGGWKPRVGEPSTENFGLRKPCRCGSGKKYKRCCLGQDLAEAEWKRLNAGPSMPVPVKTGRTLGDDDGSVDGEGDGPSDADGVHDGAGEVLSGAWPADGRVVESVK